MGDSRFFELIEVRKGVCAAVEKAGTDTGSNAGFVDMGDYTIVFDSFLNVDAAADLKAAAVKCSAKEPALLINSHFHIDHVMGNCVFSKETKIVTSSKVREKISTEDVKMMEEIGALDKQILVELQEQISSEADITKQMNLKNEYKFLSNIMKPNVTLRIPEITFDNSLVIRGENRTAEIRCFEIGHSPGDVILYLPEDKVCFTGDLMFKNMHPWLGTGDPESFVNVLEELLKLDAEIYIPGHGVIASKSDIELQIKYIKELLELVRTKLEKGEDASGITIEDISEEFRSWNGLCFMWNIEFLFNKFSKA